MTQNAVIYARVSTSEQTKGYSLPSQVKGGKVYAQQHGLDVVAVIEDDVSGATRLEEREGGRRMLEMVNKKQVQAVIVWRLDRLARPPEGEYSRLLTTIEHFARHQVTVHDCETGQINSDMSSVMIAFFKGLAASQERAAIRERSMRGIKAKAEAGKYVGQGDPPYGYEKVGIKREARLEIHPERAQIVQRIFYLYTDNAGKPLTFKQIAVLLTHEGIPTPGQVKVGGKTGRGGWYPTTIRLIITNPNYIGEFSSQGFETQKPELAIIDGETWERARARRAINQKRSARNQKRRYLLASHLRCKCGGALTGDSKKRKKGGYNVYYKCKKRRYDHIEFCDMPHVRADVIEPLVWEWLENLLTNEDLLREGLEGMAEKARMETMPARERLQVVEELIGKAEKDIARLVSAFGDEDDSTIAAALRSKVKEKADLKESLEREKDGLLATIQQADFTPELQKRIMAIVADVADRLPSGTYESKRQLLDIFDVQAQIVQDENGDYFVKVDCRLTRVSGRIKYTGHRFKSGHPDRKACPAKDRLFVWELLATPRAKLFGSTGKVFGYPSFGFCHIIHIEICILDRKEQSHAKSYWRYGIAAAFPFCV